MANPRFSMITVAALSLAISGLLVSPALAATSATTARPKAPVVFGAGAWGSTVETAGHHISSGRTALAAFGCTTNLDLDKTNSVAGVNLPDIADLGVVTSEVTTAQVGANFVSTGHSTVADVDLLSGEIELEGIDVVASATNSPTGNRSNVVTTIGSLTIGGEPIDLTGPEQVINIPGVAKVTLNHQVLTKHPERASASGTAIMVELLGTGVIVKIGNASASIDERSPNALFAGEAYTSSVYVDDEVEVGRTAFQHLPCVGTFGKDRATSTVAGDLGDIGTIGATTTTVNATATPLPDATVTAQVADVSLPVLGIATITITGITAQAHASEDAGGNVTTDLGVSSVGSIKVKPPLLPAIDIPIPAQPNTSITLPLGLGTIKFMTTTNLRHGRGLQVVALMINLPALNTDITLGSAAASIKM